MSALCPMDGRPFDACSDYAGRPYEHPSTRRDYCSQDCKAAAARERGRRRHHVAAQAHLRRDLAALEAGGQGALLDPADLARSRPLRRVVGAAS